ncbi:hypothetical protein BAUCODRAFT_129148 [Baudoinia panamericana UAMH 10762]|uniref:Apple domain-containing protein n=1 Tax=Baudoinia panamericana (strain UAMH 10762) TaxID=717646 RepID=M2LW22_BAUPA|nr:uncharacterized protein BAUCODRAFT_129148 [Baudoinia panamericana UAMH 10762]EMC98862.1 hypothetical protein BAUCODRAFT_129148 [Baudoinia panamericana UAMH 10762]
MAKLFFAALFAAAAVASPVEIAASLEERNAICDIVQDIVTLMHQQSVATPFCSSLLSIPTITSTATVTSSPACKTITSSVPSTATITAISTVLVSTVTTVYPVVAISTTSTCALGATVIASSNLTSAATIAKRDTKPCTTTTKPQTTTALGTPTCLTKWQGAALSSACGCLDIPTPTSLSIVTTTLPVKTITKVIASTASVTVTSVTTSTTFTSTYSATQYYTSTFTILPSPTGVLTLPNSQSYGVFNNLDFAGQDIVSFFCYQNGPAPPSPYPACASFNDCVAECGYYNDNKLGASTNTTCGAVVYNAPPDGSSGYCYMKTGQTGCGSPNSKVTTGVLLPLLANDVQ